MQASPNQKKDQTLSLEPQRRKDSTYNIPSTNPAPAPKLMTNIPTLIIPPFPPMTSSLPAELMFIPSIPAMAVPVIIMPLIDMSVPVMTVPSLIVIPASMVPSLIIIPASMVPEAAVACAVPDGGLSHIMVTTAAPEVADAVESMLIPAMLIPAMSVEVLVLRDEEDCARARGARARRVRVLSAARALGCMFAVFVSWGLM